MTSFPDDDDDFPVRDNFSGIASKRPRQEDSVQKTFMKRDMVAKLNRNELEDQFLRMYDENLLLKKHCRKQEEKIKKMATKQLRLVNDRKKLLQDPLGKDINNIQLDDELEALQQRIRELEKQNSALKLRVVALKQTLGSPARATVYGHVQARIDTGIPHAPPTESRIARSMRILAPTIRNKAGRSLSIGNSAQINHLEEENQQLESVNNGLKNQLVEYEQVVQNLREQIKHKEHEFEGELSKTKLKFGQDQRAFVQENIDKIRIERELKEKSSSFTQLHAQYSNLEEKLHLMKTSHDRVLHEMESLNEQLKVEQKKVMLLQTQLKSNTAVQRQLSEGEQRITDLQREIVILKEANEKLVSSAFDLEKEREWRQRENYLKVQIAQLEATLKADVGEKGGILDKLTEEREMHEKLEEEHRDLRIKFFEMKQKHDDVMDKMSFFSQDSAINMQEFEEALVIVKHKQQSKSPELEFLQRVDEEQHKDLDRAVRQLQAEHADTINELEKTRNMLIVQYKINKDYQMEVDIATKKLEENEREYKTRLDEYAQLLDIRAARIRKLEAQLKDVAYGTRQYRIKPEDKDVLSEEDDLEDTIHLELGQNLFEIHISKVEFSSSGLRQLKDEEPNVFCTWEFYEFEIQSTPVRKGQRVEYDFTSQYVVKVDDFFLLYLQKNCCVLELHQSFGTDYQTVAAGNIRMQDLLEKPNGRLHGTLQLTGVRDGDPNVNYGTVDYWVRLRIPMEQALRLYRERTKAMGYVESNLLKTDHMAVVPLDEVARLQAPDNINQLLVHVIGCSNIESRRKDIQPSPYCIYKFFDYPDHDTRIVPSSNQPHFDDHKTFPVEMTEELDKYLISQVLKVFVFDDTDPNTTSYLGVSAIPLIPLSHNKEIKGSFALVKSDESHNGTIDISIRWKYSYIPPRSISKASKLGRTLQSKQDPLLPGEKEVLHPAKNGTRAAKDRRSSRPPPSASPRSECRLSPDASKQVSPRQVLAVESPAATPKQRVKVEVELSPNASEPDEEMIGEIGGESTERNISPKSENQALNSGDSVTLKPESAVSDEESILDESQAKETNISECENRPTSRASQRSQGSEDSEGVVMPHGRQPGNTASTSSAAMDPSDVVTIVVSHISLNENSPLLSNDSIRMLFVEYHFLGVPLEETETPYSLPKPTVPNKPISFNFTKVFHVDYESNYEKRQYLGGMLLPDDPDNGRIRFTIVSEPLDEDDEDCSDVGAAYVSIPDILRKEEDIVNREIPNPSKGVCVPSDPEVSDIALPFSNTKAYTTVQVYDINDERNCIGMLGVTIECFAALKVIERQLKTETLSS